MSDASEDDLWELVGFLKGGEHRYDVFVLLAREGAKIPSEVADELGKSQQRVYDAQEELKRRDLVELKVPEDTKKGRLHAVTERGERVWEFMLDEGIEDERSRGV